MDYQEDKSRGGVGRRCKERSAGDMGPEEQRSPALGPAKLPGQQDAQLYALPVLPLLAQRRFSQLVWGTGTQGAIWGRSDISEGPGAESQSKQRERRAEEE